ncbi:MAG TPA: hypothetical protein VKE74_34595 [Gemmataceae bacterium]|nr:hypothetical protein [Gemmataceae bacterium]
MYDRGECREFARFEPQTAPSRVDAIQFSPDGDTLVLFAGDRAQLWDVSSQSVCVGQIVCSHSVFAFHPTAPVFASLNPDRVLTLFGLQTGQPIRSLDFALGRAVRCVAFAPDGLTCAVGGSNKKFVVFDVDV